MIQMNLFTEQKDLQTQRTDLWLPRGRGCARKVLGIGIADANIYRGLNNKVLPYSTRNYRQ